MPPTTLLDELRTAAIASGLGVKNLSVRAAVDKGQVSRFLKGSGLGIHAAEKIMKVLGYTITPPKSPAKKKTTKKKG